MIYIPEKIKKIIGEYEFEQNEIGMSGSTVLMFPEHVLKIQKQSAESENEKEMADRLGSYLPLPKVLVYLVEDGIAYTLMTRMSGKMLCEEEFLTQPEKLIELTAKGIKRLWEVDMKNCPGNVSLLEERLKEARRHVENGEVDVDNVEPETFGPDGFDSPESLLVWLEENRPKEDIVLTHGDFCVPNIFTDGEEITGYIDLGKMGPADRWQDIAIVLRSLHHNFSGRYSAGKSYFDFKPQMLLDMLGIEMDEKKNRYYMLLDELF